MCASKGDLLEITGSLAATPPTHTLCKVIVPVRDPFSHLISRLFQNFGYRAKRSPVLRGCRNYFDADLLRSVVIELAMLGESQPGSFNRQVMSKYWLEEYVCPFFNIDADAIFKHPDVHTGRLHVSKGNVALLIFRYELADPEKEKLIARFIDVPGFKITQSRNVGENKSLTGDIYAFCKRHVKFPRAFYDEVCQSRFYHAFYSEAERAQMEQHWIDPAM